MNDGPSPRAPGASRWLLKLACVAAMGLLYWFVKANIERRQESPFFQPTSFSAPAQSTERQLP